ncbi:MAG: hypothetical protein AAF721_03085, partial [Myxococcota bacterium]
MAGARTRARWAAAVAVVALLTGTTAVAAAPPAPDPSPTDVLAEINAAYAAGDFHRAAELLERAYSA